MSTLRKRTWRQKLDEMSRLEYFGLVFMWSLLVFSVVIAILHSFSSP